MTDGPGSTPAGTPEDPRPRPKYGELAPEGWKPPAQPAAPHHAVPHPAAPRHPVDHPAAPTRPSAPIPAWDRPVTLGLLVLGIFGTFFAISVFGALPEAVQMLYTQQGLGTYEPAAPVSGILTGGIVAQILVWLATATVSILLLVRGRRAFYVPLIGGVVSFVVIFVFMSIVLGSDPTLLNFYNRP